MTKHETIAVADPNIYTALAAAQAQMGKALKDSKNPHFKSSYADLASVMGAVMPALNANGISLTQPTGRDETGGDFVDTILTHGASETNVSCRVFLILGKRDMQGYGSAVTYARRYGLMSMAGIAPEDDDGNAAVVSSNNAPRQQQAPEIAPEAFDIAVNAIGKADTYGALQSIWHDLPRAVQQNQRVIEAKEARKRALDPAMQAPASDAVSVDEIPY